MILSYHRELSLVDNLQLHFINKEPFHLSQYISIVKNVDICLADSLIVYHLKFYFPQNGDETI